MTNPAMTNPEVTQALVVTGADRERYLSLNTLPAKYRDAVMAGEWDKTTGVQALAAHRTQAEQRGGEPVAWLYEPMLQVVYGTTVVRLDRLPDGAPKGWTETPLYARPLGERP